MFITLEEGIIEIEVKFLEGQSNNQTQRFTLKDLQTKPEFQKGYKYIVENYADIVVGSQI